MIVGRSSMNAGQPRGWLETASIVQSSKSARVKKVKRNVKEFTVRRRESLLRIAARVRRWRRSVEPSRAFIGILFWIVFSAIYLAPVPGHGTHHLPARLIFGIPLVIGMTMALLVLYGYRFHSRLYASTRRLSLIGLASAIAILGIRLDHVLPFYGVHLPMGWGELTAVTTAAALLTMMVDARTALVCSASLVVFAGLLAGVEATNLAYLPATSAATLASAFVAIYSLHQLQTRASVVTGALVLCCANAGVSLLLQFMMGKPLISAIYALQYTFLSSVTAIVLFFVCVAVLERPLGITTHLGLLELSDLNRPLLRRLSMEAPGTYAHSIMVSNLAASAAEAVGADALLARVGAIYHDIGKIRRASFFIENQSGENVHERISPSLSAVVLTAHVREGLEIAEDEHLPPAIREIIEQHHGTSLIRYFYHRAKNNSDVVCDTSLEQRFRYPGPKPKSKEAAIVMLADSVEAASHTLARPSRAHLEEFVQQLFDGLIADEQLEDSPLLLKDLKVIRETFVRHLCGMMHHRIAYPQLEALRAESRLEILPRGDRLVPLIPVGMIESGAAPLGLGDGTDQQVINHEADAEQAVFRAVHGPGRPPRLTQTSYAVRRRTR